MEVISKRPKMSIKEALRLFRQNGSLSETYERFWGRQGAEYSEVTRTVYNRLGGNKRPVVSTIGAFAYSGLMHAIDPMMTLFYTSEIPVSLMAKVDYPEVVGSQMLFLTAAWAMMGVPVAINKMRRSHRSSQSRQDR
jgi:hypothetical protein